MQQNYNILCKLHNIIVASLSDEAVEFMTMNEEIEKLEIKISYLEAGIAELNDVVIQQQKTIDSLSYSLEKMQEKLQSLIEEVGTPNRPNRRPPHY